MQSQPGVVLQPPECRPRDDGEHRPPLPQALELVHGAPIIDGRSTVLPAALRKRQRLFGGAEFGPDSVLIDEDEGLPGSNDAGQLARCLPGALRPLIRYIIGQLWGGNALTIGGAR